MTAGRIVCNVCAAGVMTVLRRPPTWDEAKKQLGDSSFMSKLLEFDKDKLDDGLLKKIAKFTAVRMAGRIAAREQTREDGTQEGLGDSGSERGRLAEGGAQRRREGQHVYGNAHVEPFVHVGVLPMPTQMQMPHTLTRVHALSPRSRPTSRPTPWARCR